MGVIAESEWRGGERKKLEKLEKLEFDMLTTSLEFCKVDMPTSTTSTSYYVGSTMYYVAS